MDSLLAELSEDANPRSILQLAKAYKKHLKKEERYWAQRHFTVIINNLEAFIARKHKPDQIGQISAAWIEDFQDFLLNELHTDKRGNPIGGNSNNTVRKKLQRLKGFTDWLLKQEEIDTDPYRQVDRVKAKKVNSKVKLSYQQVQTLQALSLEPYSKEWNARNFFLYSFYNAGIRFGDLCCLKWSNLIDGRLVYTMNKTGKPKSIKQLAPMRRILNHYRNDKEQPEAYIFPILSGPFDDPMALRKQISRENVKVNKRLKNLAKKAGIQANISFHVSRHSFAQYALREGMDLYAISKALGHADLKITEEYIKSFDEELLDQSMGDLFE